MHLTWYMMHDMGMKWRVSGIADTTPLIRHSRGFACAADSPSLCWACASAGEFAVKPPGERHK